MDFFLAYHLGSAEQEPENREPAKCSELVWADLGRLPEDTIAYVRAGIENFRSGTWFQEFGWDAVWSNDAVQPTGARDARPSG